VTLLTAVSKKQVLNQLILYQLALKMTLKIIQWNMNGYSNNYCELQTIIKKHTLLIISLQETHIKFTSHISIPINLYLFQKTPHLPTVA